MVATVRFGLIALFLPPPKDCRKIAPGFHSSCTRSRCPRRSTVAGCLRRCMHTYPNMISDLHRPNWALRRSPDCRRPCILPALVRAASRAGAKPTPVGSPVAGIFWVVQTPRPCRLQPPRRPRCCERTSPSLRRMRWERHLVGHGGTPPPGPLDSGRTPPQQREQRVDDARVL